MTTAPRIGFSAIGLNHGHIYGQVNLLLLAGGALISFFATEPELIAAFQQTYPDARLAESADAILHDARVQLVVTAAIPDQRAAIAIAAMQHGKDVMSDKPGCVSLEQLAALR